MRCFHVAIVCLISLAIPAFLHAEDAAGCVARAKAASRSASLTRPSPIAKGPGSRLSHCGSLQHPRRHGSARRGATTRTTPLRRGMPTAGTPGRLRQGPCAGPQACRRVRLPCPCVGRQKRVQKAVADCDNAIALEPKFAQAYATRPMPDLPWAMSTRPFPIATKLWLWTQSWRTRTCAGAAHGSKNASTKRRVADTGKALALDPGFWEVHLDRGNSWCELGNSEEALTEYELALASAPKDAAPNNIGVLHWKLAQQEDQRAATAEAAGNQETANECRREVRRIEGPSEVATGSAG